LPRKINFRFSVADSTGDWIYETKFDGYRAIALSAGDQVRLLSRNANDLSRKFPGIIQSLWSLYIGEAILDGELDALDEEATHPSRLD
jgi:bifunctional non-homologous end joining protein LigD